MIFITLIDGNEDHFNSFKHVSYRGTKWLKFNFVIHPKELEEVLKPLDYFIPITHRRVEENYQITDKTSLFPEYEAFYNKVISGQKWSKEDWNIDFHTHLTDNPELIQYEVFEREEDNEIKRFKRSIQLEPVINMSSFSLTASNQKLSVAFHDHTRNAHLGVQINYPKEILYLETNELISTEELSTFQLYTSVIKSIKKISKKATSVIDDKTIKPNFWVSKEAIKDINNNINLKTNKIIIS